MKRVTATVRTEDSAKIVEASAPAGAGLLVEFRPSPDGEVLYVFPYRADASVYLMTRGHSNDCAVYARRDDLRRCDCGACSTFDAKAGVWIPTSKPGHP